MSSSLMDAVGTLLTPQLLGSMASQLGESEGAVKNGLQGSAATIFSALAGKATDTGFLGQILGLATGGDAAGLASQFLGMIFGGGQGAITDLIGKAAGLKGGSAASILSMAAPLVLGMLGKKASSGLGAAALGSLLSSEAGALKSFLPAGIGSLLGGLGDVGHAVSGSHSHAAVAHSDGSGSNWLIPVAVAALLAGALYWFTRSDGTAQEAAKETKAAVVETATAANPLWAALGDLFKRALPGGLELSIPKLGVENRLIDFIEDKAKPVDKTTWFDFDRLLFDTAKETLQPASQEQLTNVANILKAFPEVNLKIGGYTDNTGNKAANMTLSAARAKTVMTELVGMGIAAARLESEGYGDQFPVGDNATEEGRAKNRRVSMRVTKK